MLKNRPNKFFLTSKQILKLTFISLLIFNIPINDIEIYGQKGGVIFEPEKKSEPKNPVKPRPRPRREKPKNEPVEVAPAPVEEVITPIESLPVKNRKYALVIGIDKYDNPDINPLDTTVNDAKTLAAALQVYAGFPQDQVILLSPNQTGEFKSTRQNIIKWLSRLSKSAAKDGLLFISFSGHGVEINKEAFLLASDSELSDSVRAMSESSIRIDSIKDIVQESGTSQVVLLLDACRTNPKKGQNDQNNLLSEAYLKAVDFYNKDKGVLATATLSASSLGERSYEDTEKKQSYFTTALVEGLKGRAANEKGEVTFEQLEAYVQDRVFELVEGKNVAQVPQFKYKGYTKLSIFSALPNTNNPQSDDLYAVAKSAFENNDLQKAAETYKTILLVDNEPVVYLNLGQIYLAQNKPDEALKIFAELIKLNPENANGHYLIGQAQILLNNDKEAIESLKNAAKLKDNLSRSFLPETFLSLGNVYFKLGNTQEAMAALQEATTLKPDYSEEVYFKLGEASRLSNSYKEAIAAYNKALSLPGANYGIGLSYTGLGAEGKVQAKQFLDQAKAAAKTSFKQGEDARKTNNFQAASEAFLLAVKHYPEDDDSHFQLGYAYLQLGNKDLARKQHEILSKIKSSKATELLKEINKAK
jgi:tetratricopeptide (TPR) repeat protein